jgi:hypothetical protein
VRRRAEKVTKVELLGSDAALEFTQDENEPKEKSAAWAVKVSGLKL